MTKSKAHAIEHAILRASQHYFDDCRQRIKPFVESHFQYPGAWQLNKLALGWDLLRAPANLFWAPVYTLAQLLRWLFRKLGYETLARVIARIPGGLTTRVQQQINDKVTTELLQLKDGPLEKALIGEIQRAVEDSSDSPELLSRWHETIKPALKHSTEQYLLTRTATADISNSLLSAITGVFAFKKFTPGGLAIGISAAAWWSHRSAANQFVFGETLGDMYYSLFPATPSTLTTLISIILTLVVLASFSALSGLITDPLQSRIGLHQRRLRHLIDHLEKDFVELAQGSYRPKDQYLARFFEVMDALRSHF